MVRLTFHDPGGLWEPHARCGARCELQQPASQWLNRNLADEIWGCRGQQTVCRGRAGALQGSEPLEALEPPLLQETATVTAAARTQARPLR